MAAVVVGWHPAKSTNYRRGRGGHVPIAEVDHRMVGWLTGTRRWFTVSSTRPVSTHFGIGHAGPSTAPLCPECGPLTGARGPLVVDQYVDLADTAYGNGNYDPSGGWPLVRRDAAGAVLNPNLYTYSIEHEDGATAGRGIVTPHVRRVSVALTELLHRGDLDELRAAGVRVGAQAWHGAAAGAGVAAALRAIPAQAERFVSHHRIAGRLKPYCWEPWLSDLGFVGGGTQGAKLAALAPPALPTAPNLVCAFDTVRLRVSPGVTARVWITVDAGRRARAEGGLVTGGWYIVHGRGGRTWWRIVALDGRRLTRALYTAAPLWRAIR